MAPEEIINLAETTGLHKADLQTVMPEKDTKKNKYDVAVIGAGPAGMMAAGKAASLGLKVVLIDKNSTPGKKLLLTGGGRCNLTNAEFNLKNLVSNYNNGEFLFHAFSVFGPKETIALFEKLGVKTKIENNKKVFPVSNSSERVLHALENYLAENKVEMMFGTDITDVVCKKKQISKIISGKKEITAKKYILCAGGKSYSLTGSTGFGYKLAEKLGHTIVTPLPALSPVRVKESWIKNLQGISLKDVKITVYNNSKKVLSEEGEFLFTQNGVSGPAVLNISGKVASLLQNGKVKISFDLFPLLNHEELLKGFEDVLQKNPRQIIKNILSSFVADRLVEVLLNIAKVDTAKLANNLSKAERFNIVKTLKNIEVSPDNNFNFEEAHVTQGGISLEEIDHKTMQSKIIDNLYFAGEIIDIDGKSGGFNLQMCWTTGHLAGEIDKNKQKL